MTAIIIAQANFQHAYQNQQTYALQMDAYMKGTCVCDKCMKHWLVASQY